jgi:hypothetical protein
MANIPATTTPGQTLVSTGFQNGSAWSSASGGVITRSYIVQGPLVAYTFPGFSVALPSGALYLIAVVTQLSAGTGTVDITQCPLGGSPATVSGLTGLSVTTTDSGYINPSGTVPVADLDKFSFVLSSPSGTGDIVIDYVFSVTP